MYERIMVPTDGSDAAVAAGKAAFALARAFDSTLHAVHVREDDTSAERASALVEAIAEVAAELDEPTTTAVLDREESVPRTLISHAEESGVNCIVMGTHGRKGLRASILGSVTERTLREAPVPVVTVDEETVVTADIEEILVPTDGSDCANAAVDHAVELAAATGAAVHLVHVVDVPVMGSNDLAIHDALEAAGRQALEEGRERAHEAGVADVEATLMTGRTHEAIQECVEARDVDCVVMGTHGYTGVSRAFLGSITERVVRLVDVPVVAVKSQPPDD